MGYTDVELKPIHWTLKIISWPGLGNWLIFQSLSDLMNIAVKHVACFNVLIWVYHSCLLYMYVLLY